MKKGDILYLCIAAFVSIGFSGHLFHTAGLMPTLIIGFCAFGAGIAFWLLTSFRHPTDPTLLLPPYLFTAALLMLHIIEEYAFNFAGRVAQISGGDWTNEQFLFTIGYAFPALWIFGAYAIVRRNPLGGYISSFIFIGMLLGEPTHYLIFPMREASLNGGGYDYFPGMWTALAPMSTGLWGISIVLSEARKEKRRAKSSSASTWTRGLS